MGSSSVPECVLVGTTLSRRAEQKLVIQCKLGAVELTQSYRERTRPTSVRPPFSPPDYVCYINTFAACIDLKMHKISVVVPTTLHRPGLLQRALEAVAKQERAADYVVVTCDATDEEASAARAASHWPSFAGELHIVTNQQLPGLSTNLNSAFEYIAAFCPGATIVSLLDDDDFWSANYLASVEEQFDSGADFVAAPFVYLGKDQRREPPNILEPDQFLIGNPGISNSTMSINFELLQKIGGWTNGLLSCTDRDACLRLCKATARYAVVNDATVYIDRGHGSPRLTDRGGAAKFDGLEFFYEKWRHAMAPDVYEASRSRALRLFDYDPGVATPPVKKTDPQIKEHLIIATISTCPKLLNRLLVSLDTHAAPIFRVTVFVLRNNEHAEWGDPTTRNLELRYYTTPASGAVLKVAEARGCLQDKVRDYLNSRPTKPPVWFLDDDFIVSEAAVGKIEQAMFDPDLKADAILGTYIGDSPNAALSGLLFELQDLKANLHWLQDLPAQEPLPNRSKENTTWMQDHPKTYYYALSLNSKPKNVAWLEPAHDRETVQEARDRLLNELPNLAIGNSVFRKLRTFGDPVKLEVGAETLHRGGTIVIFNPAMLEVPFPVISGPNGSLRRSDMMWALLATRKNGHMIRESNIATLHRRHEAAKHELSIEKSQDEVIGSCVFNSLLRALDSPEHERFADILKERAEKTQTLLEHYFREIDQALEELDRLNNARVFQLTIELRLAINEAFKKRLMEEVSCLTRTDRASQIELEFHEYTE